MGTFTGLTDLLLTADGDLARSEEGELVTVSDNELLAQHIQARLQNSNPDIFYDTTICADLEDLLGLPNEKATAITGQKMIQTALMDVMDPNDILIQPIPISKVSIIFFVFVNVDNVAPLGFEVKLALGSTINVKRVK